MGVGVQRISMMEVPFGALLRGVHHWAANLMILSLFLHLFSTLLMKAYRPPRELTWLTGLGLAGLSLVFGFSGYLLPWDDLLLCHPRRHCRAREGAARRSLDGRPLARWSRGHG